MICVLNPFFLLVFLSSTVFCVYCVYYRIARFIAFIFWFAKPKTLEQQSLKTRILFCKQNIASYNVESKTSA